MTALLLVPGLSWCQIYASAEQPGGALVLSHFKSAETPVVVAGT